MNDDVIAPDSRGFRRREHEVTASSPTQSQEISLMDLLDIARARWILIGTSTLICALAATAIAFTITPVYRGEVLLVPADTDEQNSSSRLGGIAGQLGELASFAGIAARSTSKEEAIAILQSRALTDRFVEEKHLLPILFKSKWDAGKEDWKSSDPEKIPTLWDAYKKIGNLRRVVEDKKTGLVSLTVDWSDPVLAAEWANDLVARTNQYMRSRALSHSSANVDFLKGQLDRTNVVEIRNSINSLIEGELKKSMIASGTEEYAFKVVDPAVVPKEKYSPRRLHFLIGGAVLGFLLSAIKAFFDAVEPRKHA